MGRVLGGVNEPDEPNRPDAELIIRMTVPEEFAGWSMGELNSRRGCIIGMDVQHGNVVIRGSVPTTEYQALADAIAVATKRLGRIEREGAEST
jgi:translation elongation factor EF-G